MEDFKYYRIELKSSDHILYARARVCTSLTRPLVIIARFVKQGCTNVSYNCVSFYRDECMLEELAPDIDLEDFVCKN